ncbi:uncharacterized protein YlaI [Lipingzhangella halophila]|uniref:Uncharacterized protein YlaI n=1 Tax=Lipingzhangella halophila TaxID=1783352 RepID=A0A7W7RG76_9ACTN|nr:uncharacterized protein YlaI [Lipingzhangella halophila]
MLLIAANTAGARTLATRDLQNGPYTCPQCSTDVVLKRGRKVTAHFAHTPGSACQAAGESTRHLLAKQVLAEEFTRLGYQAHIEVVHHAAGRRVDVVAARTDEHGRQRRVAVEIQDSAIQVDTAKKRVVLDRRLGYDATVWLFTTYRAAALFHAKPDAEVRVPNEMLWADHRYGHGVHLIDPDGRAVWRAELSEVYREGESREWYDEDGDPTGVDYPGYVPKTIRTVQLHQAGFRLTSAPGLFGDAWSIVFAAEPEGSTS